MDLAPLIKTSDRIIDATSTAFVRDNYDLIDWNGRLILIQGFRGVGKTTLLLQRVKKACDLKKSIFISLDHLHFTMHTLLETVDALYDSGYRTWVIDEVHRYPGWSTELKNIYDGYPDVRVWATSSSALNIFGGAADLSRRADVYAMDGMTFREYLALVHKISIPMHDFDDLVTGYDDIYHAYYERYEIKRHFAAYLKYGFYPFIVEGRSRYYDKITLAMHQVIDNDLSAIFNLSFYSTRQIKKLLSLITRMKPFTPDITKIAKETEISRPTVIQYLDYLEAAGIIHTLRSEAKSDKVMAKPDKILLANTNLIYALTSEENIGSLRETFVVNCLKKKHKVSTPNLGDILLDHAYTIEIGGKSKDFHQLKGVANPLLILDNIAEGGHRIIPMWMLGLL
jgi:uncharacterized protein